MYRCIYFNIKELVSPIVHNKWKEQAWMFFDEAILQDLDYIRETWGSPIIINNWHAGYNLKQCGLRSNLDEMVKSKSNQGLLYLSAHTMGKAFDLHDKYNHNEELFNHVLKLIKNNRLQTIRRVEDYKNTSGWVHIDTFNSESILF